MGGKGSGGKREYIGFPKLRAAREAIVRKAEGIWERYETMIAMAVAAGDFETANNAYQFLLTHIPADEEGQRLLDPSIDKVRAKEEGRSLPSINIGLAIGGVRQPKALPEVVVVKESDEAEDE